MCAKSSTTHISSAADGEFLHELEEKMEVARLQLQVQKALSKLSSSRMECQEALNRLDSDLLDLTIVSALVLYVVNFNKLSTSIINCPQIFNGEGFCEYCVSFLCTALKRNEKIQ